MLRAGLNSEVDLRMKKQILSHVLALMLVLTGIPFFSIATYAAQGAEL